MHSIMNILIARGAIPHTLPDGHNTPSDSQSPQRQDWLWAMSTDKVYGFDTELTLLKCFNWSHRTALQADGPLMKEEALWDSHESLITCDPFVIWDAFPRSPRAYRMCLWRIRTRAWWMLLASPSLKTCVCSLLSKKSSTFRPRM